jgi:hypothetical protein
MAFVPQCWLIWSKMPAVGIGELVGQTLDAVCVLQHALDDHRPLLAGLGRARQALAAAHEELHAQLALQVLDVLVGASLRGEQCRC